MLGCGNAMSNGAVVVTPSSSVLLEHKGMVRPVGRLAGGVGRSLLRQCPGSMGSWVFILQVSGSQRWLYTTVF